MAEFVHPDTEFTQYVCSKLKLGHNPQCNRRYKDMIISDWLMHFQKNGLINISEDSNIKLVDISKWCEYMNHHLSGTNVTLQINTAPKKTNKEHEGYFLLLRGNSLREGIFHVYDTKQLITLGDELNPAYEQEWIDEFTQFVCDALKKNEDPDYESRYDYDDCRKWFDYFYDRGYITKREVLIFDVSKFCEFLNTQMDGTDIRFEENLNPFERVKGQGGYFKRIQGNESREGMITYSVSPVRLV